jgi:hypothetical protein
MKFKVKLQVTLTVDRDLEHYDLEEENLKGQGAVDAIQQHLEQELTDNGYQYFIGEESDCEDDHHTIEYSSE